MIRSSSQFCRHCVNPSGLGVINPQTGTELKFIADRHGILCEICAELLVGGGLPSPRDFRNELEEYLVGRKKVLFAYSGGLDSTVVLTLLCDECSRRGINLQVFTIETGVKGRTAAVNIERMIEHLGLKRSHFWVDITREVQSDTKVVDSCGTGLTAFQVYADCYRRDILPCGRICNSMIDGVYRRQLVERGISELLTGGDTPKKNSQGSYSIFWAKPSGLTIVRGGCALGLSKDLNLKFVAERGLPWENPDCGGYDTDCLMPGVHFFRILGGRREIPLEDSLSRFPIVLEYLSERVRWGVIERREALHQLTAIDTASPSTVSELQDIFK